MITSLGKRIKRNISGREQRFFAITSPGLEDLCQRELMHISSFKGQPTSVPGGVDFSGKLYDSFLANLHSRTATRILMRIESVSASHFTQLGKKFLEIPWELYLQPDGKLMIHVSTRHCRLYHKGAISDCLLESIRCRISQQVEKPEVVDKLSAQQHLFVRGMDDQFSLSIDSSGDLLYKRGIKTTGGKAPIRETLASAVLMLAGYTGKEPLLNPLCGSGTFAIEAALMIRNIPPGWFRSFAFTGWPGFRPTQWAHIRKMAEAQFVSAPSFPVFASDQSLASCEVLSQLVDSQTALENIHVFHGNFFDLNPATLSHEYGLVVINPPYGKRMGDRQESRMLILEIMKKLKADYRGWRFALIVPRCTDIQQLSSGWKFHSIYHGGLKLVLLTGKLS